MNRQISSSLFERLAISKDDKQVRKLSEEGQIIDKLKHQDLGQMQMYVNYYDRFEKLPEENPTIGILLCKEKNKAVVEMTLPEKSNIYAKEYQLYLPTKKQLEEQINRMIK